MSAHEPLVHIVDDDGDVRKALARLFDSAGVSAATHASAQEFLERFDPDVAGCLLLDLEMPGLDGLQLQQELRERGSVMSIVFLTGHGDVPSSVSAMKGGASDFLTKPVDDQVLLSAVAEAVVRAGAEAERHRRLHEIRRRLSTLTPREREVLPHVLSGRLNKQIAHELGTVEKTIKVHRSRVMHKLGVRTVADLVRLAEFAGIAPAQR